MNLINSCINSVRVLKNLIEGRHMRASLGSGRNLKCALSGLSLSFSRVEIQCILSGYLRSGAHWIRNVIEKNSNQKTYDLFNIKLVLALGPNIPSIYQNYSNDN